LTAVNCRPRQKEDFAHHPTSGFFAAFESNLTVRVRFESYHTREPAQPRLLTEAARRIRTDQAVTANRPDADFVLIAFGGGIAREIFGHVTGVRSR
jgi:hypothetical protein